MQSSKYIPPKLKILITVVNRSKTEFFLDLISGYEVNMQASVTAQGTAKEIAELTGLSDSQRTVIFSVIREDKEDALLRMLESKFSTVKNGNGIAYTVPMTSVIGVAIYSFLSNHS